MEGQPSAEEFEIYCIGSLEFSRFTKVTVFSIFQQVLNPDVLVSTLCWFRFLGLRGFNKCTEIFRDKLCMQSAIMATTFLCSTCNTFLLSLIPCQYHQACSTDAVSMQELAACLINAILTAAWLPWNWLPLAVASGAWWRLKEARQLHGPWSVSVEEGSQFQQSHSTSLYCDALSL